MDSLTNYDAMHQAIILAHDVDDVKEIRDRATALRQYAKQSRMSVEDINRVTEIKLRAERKAGELLAVIEREKNQHGKVADPMLGSATLYRRTLAENDIAGSTAHNWQSIAALPEDTFEATIAETKANGAELTTAAMLKVASAFKREAKRQQHIDGMQANIVEQDNGVWHGDMRELSGRIQDESVDLILTDPPYPGEFLPLFGDLAAIANRILKPGGLCLVYSGQIFLPEVIAHLSTHLEYLWTFAIRHGGGNQRIFKVNVNTGWKPVLAYCKAPTPSPWWDSFIDVVTGTREKELHDWQQAESEAAYFIEHLTTTGQSVVDPFCGSGTVLNAAKLLGRQYIGIELDESHVESARRRLRNGTG